MVAALRVAQREVRADASDVMQIENFFSWPIFLQPGKSKKIRPRSTIWRQPARSFKNALELA